MIIRDKRYVSITFDDLGGTPAVSGGDVIVNENDPSGTVYSVRLGTKFKLKLLSPTSAHNSVFAYANIAYEHDYTQSSVYLGEFPKKVASDDSVYYDIILPATHAPIVSVTIK